MKVTLDVPQGALQLKTAAAYLRVSTGQQTVLNQKMALTEYAQAHKLQIVNFFEDSAVSGTVAPLERAGFKALMDFIRANKVDHVLIFDLTRIGRTFWDTLVAIREIERYSVLNAASSKDSFLNLGQESMRQMFISMLAWFAEREREMIIERIRAGMARAKAQGIQLGRREKPLSVEDMQDAIEFLKMPRAAGPNQKMQQVAEMYGLSHTTLYKKLSKAGYIQQKPVVRIDADMLLDALDHGWPHQLIADQIGITREDLYWAVQNQW